MQRTIDISVLDLTRTIMLLDAAQDALDAMAKDEQRREAGKRMRSITHQERAKHTRTHVAMMKAEYGLEID